MKVITRSQFLPPPSDPTPLLSIEEKLKPVKLELIRETEADGIKVNEITLHVPTSRDMLTNQMTPERTADTTYESLAKACDGVTPAVIEALHVRDLNYLSRLYFAYQE